MITSELLEEKRRTQKILAGQSASVHDYMERSHRAAKMIAESYGFSLKYAEMPNTTLNADPSAAAIFPCDSSL